jgi:mono/diheme cytochrome c family protein
VEHGAYVAATCRGCHRENLEGGPVGGAPPEWPPAANLTPSGGVMARYDSAEKFVAMMRTGNRPDGTKVNDAMPFMSLRNMNDTDLNAVYAYLRSLPAH